MWLSECSRSTRKRPTSRRGRRGGTSAGSAPAAQLAEAAVRLKRHRPGAASLSTTTVETKGYRERSRPPCGPLRSGSGRGPRTVSRRHRLRRACGAPAHHENVFGLPVAAPCPVGAERPAPQLARAPLVRCHRPAPTTAGRPAPKEVARRQSSARKPTVPRRSGRQAQPWSWTGRSRGGRSRRPRRRNQPGRGPARIEARQ